MKTLARSYQYNLEYAKTTHGDKFSDKDLAQQFIPFYESGQRIEVTTTYPSGETFVRRGRVGMTGGWVPAFILMSRVSAIGSSDVLNKTDRVTAIIDDRGRRVGSK